MPDHHGDVTELLALFHHPPGFPGQDCNPEVGAVLWITELLVRSDVPLDCTMPSLDARHRLALEYIPRLTAALRLLHPDWNDRLAATMAFSILTDAECLVAEEIERRRLARPNAPQRPEERRQTDTQTVLPVRRFRDVGAATVREAEDAPTMASRIIPTPWPTLSTWLAGGLRPGELVYVAARPAVGKSLMTGQWAMHAAQREVPTLIVSREMPVIGIGRRLIAQESGTSLRSLRTGQNVDWQRVAATLHRLYDVPLWLTDAPTSVDEIVQILPSCGTPLRAVFVDYLQLLQRTARPQRDKRAEVEAVSAALKQIAIKHHLAIVVISSVGRPERGQKVRPPDLASLRESGQLEHDADVVLTLHRDPIGERPEDAVLSVVKSREDMTGVIHLRFDTVRLTFGELDLTEAYHGDD